MLKLEKFLIDFEHFLLRKGKVYKIFLSEFFPATFTLQHTFRQLCINSIKKILGLLFFFFEFFEILSNADFILEKEVQLSY